MAAALGIAMVFLIMSNGMLIGLGMHHQFAWNVCSFDELPSQPFTLLGLSETKAWGWIFTAFSQFHFAFAKIQSIFFLLRKKRIKGLCLGKGIVALGITGLCKQRTGSGPFHICRGRRKYTRNKFSIYFSHSTENQYSSNSLLILENN